VWSRGYTYTTIECGCGESVDGHYEKLADKRFNEKITEMLFLALGALHATLYGSD
jgi:hypothetical protein